MRRLFENQYDVSLKHVGNLLALSLIHNFLFVGHAFINVYSECLWLLIDFFALAINTVFLVDSTLTFAFVTVLLCLHLHEAHILHYFDDTLPFAFCAGLGFSTFGATTLASGTVDVPLNGNFFNDSIVKFFESYGEINFVLWALLALIAPSFMAFNFIFSLLIINLSFDFVSENFISTIDFCELLRSILITYIKKLDFVFVRIQSTDTPLGGIARS